MIISLPVKSSLSLDYEESEVEDESKESITIKIVDNDFRSIICIFDHLTCRF